LFKKGRDYLEEYQGIEARGASPRRVQEGGEAPRRELPFSIDFKGGVIVTLM
jgi:hypothetical protein